LKISVIGTGYVGLVSGTCFADTGNEVICVDIDAAKVDKMKKGIVPIYEPGLEILFERNIKYGRLSFTTDLYKAILNSEILFLCLPTPQDGDGSADLKYVLGVAEDLGKFFRDNPDIGFKILVNKSTVPVGTSDKVRAAVKKYAPDFDFDVASNPEFLREGMAVEDFMKPERVVVGTSNEKTKTIIEELYEPFIRSGNPIYFMDEKSSEMTKYAANSFLATKITFMNEIANLCEITGADVDRVRIGIGSDSRIGKRFLFPGIGFGGSCFPKDVKALINISNENNYDFKILKSVVEINEIQGIRFFEKIKLHYNGKIKGKHFAMWGLAFKPNTDDIRDAPSLKIIDLLIKNGASITAYDPEAMENISNIYKGKIKLAKGTYNVLENADALIIVTEWNEFRKPDFSRVKALLKKPVIFDGRNLYDLEKMQEFHFTYYSIGRNIIKG
jgi:UDPglucose 6-dehydrogenase